LYTAPATNPYQQTVTVTAVDGSQTIFSQAITLVADTITLPVEVVGANGTTSTVKFGIPPGVDLTGSLTLTMQVNNLRYQTEMSVRVNQGAWTPISTPAVTLTDQYANQFGGIGGGFSTFNLSLPLPGAVTVGANQIAFRFNGTDGITSGFRVLAFNVANSGGNLIPASTFVWDNPANWTPPLNDAADIAAGLAAWRAENTLHTQMVGPTSNIIASCADCHTQDGRDLKYFNYSNTSIAARAVFHGLTAQQGLQIASYIRSLATPAPGLPWNPPYQPGPGIDSKPVTNWAAGAGLNAVLPNDAAMLPYLTLTGPPTVLAAGSYLNARETPIALQLPTWNRWLPIVHPLDGFGAALWTSSSLYKNYLKTRADLAPGTSAAYAAAIKSGDFAYWLADDWAFRAQVQLPATSPQWQNSTYVAEFYSYRLWSEVKQWELNQEFGLESTASVAFGPKAASRAWFSNMPFMGSPFMADVPRPSPGLANGTAAAHVYLSFAWYQLQLILNDGNGMAKGTYPIDWAYSLSYLNNNLNWNGTNILMGTAGLALEWLAKGLQSGNYVDTTPDVLTFWPGEYANSVELGSQFSQELTTWTTIWLQYFQQLTAAQINSANDAATIARLQSNITAMLPILSYLGVNSTLLNGVVKAASLVWPTVNWTGILGETCTVGRLSQIQCK
jgi:cytochrome c553